MSAFGDEMVSPNRGRLTPHAFPPTSLPKRVLPSIPHLKFMPAKVLR
ncbi:hypothetical protein OROMI_006939 [Orobanche minor]